MTRKILGLALAMLALGTGPAVAETQLVQADGSRHGLQMWVEEMKMPSPDVTLTLLSSNCPFLESTGIIKACTRRGDYTIWFPRGDHETLFHEIGHNVDYYVAPEWMRYRFRVLTGDWRDWEADPNGPNESFAAAYARCSVLGAKFKGDPNIGLGPFNAMLSNHRFRQICRLLARLPG